MSRIPLRVVSLAVASLLSLPAAASSPPVPRVIENSVLRVEVTGKGRPMVFVPGLTCGGDVWCDAVAHFAARYQCHVVTLAGFAGRPHFQGPFLGPARDSLPGSVRA